MAAAHARELRRIQPVREQAFGREPASKQRRVTQRGANADCDTVQEVTPRNTSTKAEVIVEGSHGA